jgi:PRC-barrel domain protein
MTATVDKRETVALIGSDKVEGTAVYGADDQKIGSVERVMIDKKSGRVAYAVLSYGGFLGIGDEHYPTPWQNLVYDSSIGGYRVNLTKAQIQGAPKYANENDWSWSRENDQRIYDYYRVAPYWMAAS